MKKLLKSFSATLLILTAVVATSILVYANTPITISNQYSGAYVKATNIAIDYTEVDKISNSYAGKIIPIVISEPGYVEVKVDVINLQDDISLYIYKDAACTDYLSSIKYYNANDTEDLVKIIDFEQAGTYYLKAETFVSSYNTVSFRNTCNLSMSLYGLKDRTIKNNQVIYYCNESYDRPFYFKYKASKTGVVSVAHTSNAYGNIWLTNSSKKVITEGAISDYGTSDAYFGVEKGKTYYIKTSAHVYDEIMGITIKETGVKEKSGKTKKKAVTIKAKKNIKGTISAGKKQVDWYKFKNKKKKKLTLNVETLGVGKIVFTVYNSKGKKIGDYTSYGGARKLTITNSTTYGKANKGTYYVKVSRYDANSTGIYSLKWK